MRKNKARLAVELSGFPNIMVDIRKQQSNMLEKRNLGKLVPQLLCCAAFITTEAASLTHLQALN